MRTVSTLIGTSLIFAYAVIGALLMSNWAVAAASGVPLDEAIAEMQIANQPYSIVPGIIFAVLGGMLSIAWTILMLSPRFKVPAWAGVALWCGIVILGAPAYFMASFGNMNSVGDTYFEWYAAEAFRLEMPLYLASGLAAIVGLSAVVWAAICAYTQSKELA